MSLRDLALDHTRRREEALADISAQQLRSDLQDRVTWLKFGVSKFGINVNIANELVQMETGEDRRGGLPFIDYEGIRFRLHIPPEVNDKSTTYKNEREWLNSVASFSVAPVCVACGDDCCNPLPIKDLADLGESFKFWDLSTTYFKSQTVYGYGYICFYCKTGSKKLSCFFNTHIRGPKGQW